ncbi:MAG: hypothetical protein SA339_08145 [Methanomassiliicoccus sp.]|nr:hypothetical protein [Methanomassiliicoccus sp.]
MTIAPGTGGPVGVIGAGLKRAGRKLKRTNVVLLILILTVSSLIPLLLDGNGSRTSGTIINSDNTVAGGSSDSSSNPDTSTNQTSDSSDPTSTPDSNSPSSGTTEATDTPSSTTSVPNLSGEGSMALGVSSSNLTVVNNAGTYTAYSENYKIVVAQSGNAVCYVIKPYFTSDVIEYGRLNPLTGNEGTVDQYGNDLNYVTTTITSWGQNGNCVWFVESCSQYSIRHEFTIYRDYFELDVTYTPGASKVITTYAISLNSASGAYYDLFSDGKDHRYIPGTPLNTPKTNGIGGWYPCYYMYAPAFDMRVPGRSLGVEWGFSDEEAYIYSPTWISGSPVDGASVFSVKYTSSAGVLPDPALGTAKTFHMYVRPYQYTDGEARGHCSGYADWIGPQIASEWTTVSTQQFPLSFYDFGKTINGVGGQWDSSFRSFIESSPILLAQLSTNPDQVNWHYKSAQQLVGGTGTMPTEWQLWSSPGTQYYLSNGHPVATASSSAFRNYLIYQDPSNDWWWSSTGVFWDEMNSWYGENNLPRSDYNHETGDFILEGYMKLVEETRASGYFSFVITNPYTPSIHLSMVSDLSVFEGFEPVSYYGNDLTGTVESTMLFVNEMPSQYRPHLVAYQNYNADSSSDQLAVYSALFNSARYGFDVDLLSYESYSSQMHNLNMAISMYTAMGASRHQDVTNWPATIDLSSEGNSLTTNRQMVAATGSGTLSVTFTSTYDSYTVTNLYGSALNVHLTLPDGRTISGTVAAESTASFK